MSRKKVFIDTNVFLYLFDNRYREKQAIARKVLSTLDQEATIVISTQVMQEFYFAFTRKMGAEPFIAEKLTRDLRRFEVVVNHPDDVLEAIRISQSNQISFWDGLIFVAVAKAKCSELYTEDMNAGQTIESVKIVNPFMGEECADNSVATRLSAI
jgi:predicted nucleic acid-binding protein